MYAAGGQWVGGGTGLWKQRQTLAPFSLSRAGRREMRSVPADTSEMLVLSEIGGSENHVLHVAGRVRMIHVTLVTV